MPPRRFLGFGATEFVASPCSIAKLVMRSHSASQARRGSRDCTVKLMQRRSAAGRASWGCEHGASVASCAVASRAASLLPTAADSSLAWIASPAAQTSENLVHRVPPFRQNAGGSTVAAADGLRDGMNGAGRVGASLATSQRFLEFNSFVAPGAESSRCASARLLAGPLCLGCCCADCSIV